LTDLLEARLPQHPASLALKRRLAARFIEPAALPPRRARTAWVAFAGAAAMAAVVLVWFLRPPRPPEVALEAVADHQRILASTHPLDVESGGLHQVKPWFQGKLDFAPQVSFLGDDEYPLQGGALGVFGGEKAAVFVYKRRLHVCSLFVV